MHKLKRYPQRKPKKQETGSGPLRRVQASEVSEGDVSTRLHRQFYSRPRQQERKNLRRSKRKAEQVQRDFADVLS